MGGLKRDSFVGIRDIILADVLSCPSGGGCSNTGNATSEGEATQILDGFFFHPLKPEIPGGAS